MHRFRATLVVAAVLVGASLTLSGPAHAGGPTSALLSVPGEGQTASLYYTDPEYDALAGLVGVESKTGTGKPDQSGQSHDRGPGVTVTWLIHDVMPWRVDHIYLTGEGAPWIATQISIGEGSVWDSQVVWHQPESPAQLVALLDQLGVGEVSRKAGAFTGVAGAELPATAGSAPATQAPAPADGSPYAGLWWGLGGLAVGVLLTVLWARRGRWPAGESRDSGGEQVAVPGPVGADELSWPARRA